MICPPLLQRQDKAYDEVTPIILSNFQTPKILEKSNRRGFPGNTTKLLPEAPQADYWFFNPPEKNSVLASDSYSHPEITSPNTA